MLQIRYEGGANVKKVKISGGIALATAMVGSAVASVAGATSLVGSDTSATSQDGLFSNTYDTLKSFFDSSFVAGARSAGGYLLNGLSMAASSVSSIVESTRGAGLFGSSFVEDAKSAGGYLLNGLSWVASSVASSIASYCQEDSIGVNYGGFINDVKEVNSKKAMSYQSSKKVAESVDIKDKNIEDEDIEGYKRALFEASEALDNFDDDIESLKKDYRPYIKNIEKYKELYKDYLEKKFISHELRDETDEAPRELFKMYNRLRSRAYLHPGFPEWYEKNKTKIEAGEEVSFRIGDRLTSVENDFWEEMRHISIPTCFLSETLENWKRARYGKDENYDFKKEKEDYAKELENTKRVRDVYRQRSEELIKINEECKEMEKQLEGFLLFLKDCEKYKCKNSSELANFLKDKVKASILKKKIRKVVDLRNEKSVNDQALRKRGVNLPKNLNELNDLIENRSTFFGKASLKKLFNLPDSVAIPSFKDLPYSYFKDKVGNTHHFY